MKTRRRRLARTCVALSRTIFVAFAVLALVLTLSVRATVAKADDAMLELGRHLVALSETGLGKDSRGVLINGQALGMRVFTSQHGNEAILDFYESWCRGGAGRIVDHEAELTTLAASAAPVAAAQDRSWRDLTMRQIDEDIGFVACLRHGIANASAEELAARTEAFFKSGNLHNLGQFHCAAVTRIGDTTRVVAVWTEGDFYPFEMFPEEGDAPGFDASGISRPPSGRRMLSSGELGHAETLVVYTDCEQGIDELARFYRADFLKRRWRVMADRAEGSGQRLFVLQRGNEMRVVSVVQEPGELASVTIATR